LPICHGWAFVLLVIFLIDGDAGDLEGAVPGPDTRRRRRRLRHGGRRWLRLPLHQGPLQLSQRRASCRWRPGRPHERPPCRRKLRRLGRSLLRLRLLHGLCPPEGGPMELDLRRGRHRRLPPDAPGRPPRRQIRPLRGVLLALIEGAGIMMNRVLSAPQDMPMLVEDPLRWFRPPWRRLQEPEWSAAPPQGSLQHKARRWRIPESLHLLPGSEEFLERRGRIQRLEAKAARQRS
ncbi:hypothetical protein MUK42_36526, partial [Musa troglodytarum]